MKQMNKLVLSQMNGNEFYSESLGNLVKIENGEVTRQNSEVPLRLTDIEVATLYLEFLEKQKTMQMFLKQEAKDRAMRAWIMKDYGADNEDPNHWQELFRENEE
jgi:hypothetical protein